MTERFLLVADFRHFKRDFIENQIQSAFVRLPSVELKTVLLEVEGPLAPCLITGDANVQNLFS